MINVINMHGATMKTEEVHFLYSHIRQCTVSFVQCVQVHFGQRILFVSYVKTFV